MNEYESDMILLKAEYIKVLKIILNKFLSEHSEFLNNCDLNKPEDIRKLYKVIPTLCRIVGGLDLELISYDEGHCFDKDEKKFWKISFSIKNTPFCFDTYLDIFFEKMTNYHFESIENLCIPKPTIVYNLCSN